MQVDVAATNERDRNGRIIAGCRDDVVMHGLLTSIKTKMHAWY